MARNGVSGGWVQTGRHFLPEKGNFQQVRVWCAKVHGLGKTAWDVVAKGTF